MNFSNLSNLLSSSLSNTLLISLSLLFCGLLPNLSAAEKKRLLILIVASDDVPVYLEFYKSWRSYMNSYLEHIEAYFVKADPHLLVPVKIEGDVIWCRTEDGPHPFSSGIINKTVMAFEVLLPRIQTEFDYVLRASLSCFYIFPRLLQFLNTLPTEKCYAGSLTGPGSCVVSGSGFFLSPDLVKMVVEHKRSLIGNLSAPDDCLIGFLFRDYAIPIVNTYQRVDIERLDDWNAIKGNIPDQCFHFRTKSNRRIPDDLIVHSELSELFYGKPLDF